MPERKTSKRETRTFLCIQLFAYPARTGAVTLRALAVQLGLDALLKARHHHCLVLLLGAQIGHHLIEGRHRLGAIRILLRRTRRLATFVVAVFVRRFLFLLRGDGERENIALLRSAVIQGLKGHRDELEGKRGLVVRAFVRMYQQCELSVGEANRLRLM